MIDIRHLREDPKVYQDSARRRGITVDIDKILKLDGQRLNLVGEVEGLRAQLNVKGKPTPQQLKQLQKAKAELEKLEARLTKVIAEADDLLADVPNLMAPDTPEGGEEANREVTKWGKAEKRNVRDHLEIAESRGWLDFERGAKVAGNKFYYARGPLVKLEMAIMRLVMDKMEDDGFTLMSVPHLVNQRMIWGTGFSPRGEESQVYKVEGEDLNLIATAEIPLTGYHADEIVAELPLQYAALSPAYRREAGTYGKHSRGIYRVHQYDKLELYVFCRPEDSDGWLKRLVEIEQKIAQALEIPYRVTRTASGDMGAPHYEKYDLEYWSPVEGTYRELTSASNCTDYQARRLNIRYRTDKGNKFVHTLNATAVAYSRVPIALIENHQTADGRVKLPKALQSYYGGDEL